MKNILTLAAISTLLVSCTSSTTTKLKDPKTGKVVECSGESVSVPFGALNNVSFDKKDDSSCIQKYLDKGYERQSSMSSVF